MNAYAKLIEDPDYGYIIKDYLPEEYFIALANKFSRDSGAANPEYIIPCLDMIDDSYFAEMVSAIPYTAIHGAYLPSLLRKLEMSHTLMLEFDSIMLMTKYLTIQLIRHVVRAYFEDQYEYLMDGVDLYPSETHYAYDIPLNMQVVGESAILVFVPISKGHLRVPFLLDYDNKYIASLACEVSEEALQELVK